MNAKTRDVSRFIEELNRIQDKSKGAAGSMYYDEVKQLLLMSKSPYELLLHSWKFGFVCGEHYAKNQRRKRKNNVVQQ